MNIDNLIKEYFSENPKIDMFDESNIYDVYKRIITELDAIVDINTSLLQAVSYCLYEILDNVLIHSGKHCGMALTYHNSDNTKLQLLIADDGCGIYKSLIQNSDYSELSEEQALRQSIEDSVTDGQGMGFGLYSLNRLIKEAGIHLTIHSGNYKLIFHNNEYSTVPFDYWQGTIVYIELQSDKEINPNSVVDFRTDCIEQYNDMLDNDNELW